MIRFDYVLVSLLCCMVWMACLRKIDRTGQMNIYAYWFTLMAGGVFICLALRLVAFKF